MSSTKPTVGRIVHFYGKNVAPVSGDGPFAAVVTAVHSDSCISLAILAPFASNVLIGSSVMHKDVAQGDYWAWPPRE